MEETKETPQRVGVERAFEPGRLGHKWMAVAYERLVPIHRMPLCREPQVGKCDGMEVQLCAL
jgi:hypothetical protein